MNEQTVPGVGVPDIDLGREQEAGLWGVGTILVAVLAAVYLVRRYARRKSACDGCGGCGLTGKDCPEAGQLGAFPPGPDDSPNAGRDRGDDAR